jgi:acyl-CoA thioester hydrolase
MQNIVSFDLEVYSYQIDLLGHVNNAVYIHWMEIGRTKLLEAVGLPTQEIFKQGFAPVYINVWLSELNNASAILQFQFYNQHKTLIAEGLQKGLFVDLQTMRPRRLLAEEKLLFTAYLCEEVAV